MAGGDILPIGVNNE